MGASRRTASGEIVRDRAGGRPSRPPRETRGLLRMRPEVVVSIPDTTGFSILLGTAVMDIGGTALAFYGVGAGAVAASLVVLRRRLQLSRAKSPSLAGHARVARRIAALVPFYDYGEGRFFRSDNAPPDIVALRRDGFMRLSALYKSRFRETDRQTAEVADAISDLAFNQTYRVPFQYSRFVRQHLRIGAFARSTSGVTLVDLDGNSFYDLR